MYSTRKYKARKNRLNAKILGVCESRCANNGDFLSNEYKIICTDGEENEKGVGTTLYQILKRCAVAYCQLLDRILIVNLKWKLFNMAIIVVYTRNNTEQEISNR